LNREKDNKVKKNVLAKQQVVNHTGIIKKDIDELKKLNESQGRKIKMLQDKNESI